MEDDENEKTVEMLILERFTLAAVLITLVVLSVDVVTYHIEKLMM